MIFCDTIRKKGTVFNLLTGGVIMCVVAVKVPDEVILDLRETRTDFSNYIKSMVAVELYKNKKVSLGYCAEVAEMSKEEFVKCLGQNGVSIFGFDSDEEFMEELANA